MCVVKLRCSARIFFAEVLEGRHTFSPGITDINFWVQILVSTSVDGIALSVTKVSSSFNAAVISFFSSATTPGGASLSFRSGRDPTKQASVFYKFQNRLSPSVIRIRPSTGSIDVATMVVIELQVDMRGHQAQSRFLNSPQLLLLP
jgi:hypothetical protein